MYKLVLYVRGNQASICFIICHEGLTLCATLNLDFYLQPNEINQSAHPVSSLSAALISTTNSSDKKAAAVIATTAGTACLYNTTADIERKHYSPQLIANIDSSFCFTTQLGKASCRSCPRPTRLVVDYSLLFTF